jgi:hypothetical protein
MNTLLRDITSGDAHRIWSSSSAIIHTRDAESLDQLSAHLPEIRAKTAGIELGGALFPNKKYHEFALRKLEYYRNKSGCLCRLYPEYLMYDPKKEQSAGNVRIVDTSYSEGNWIDAYTCECTLCGTGFRVEEREYHYTWWGWTVDPSVHPIRVL